jgi:dCTP deaminase
MLLSELEILERLSTDDVRKRLVITPMIDAAQQIQATSVDLRLGTEFKIIRNARFPFLDLLKSREDAESDLGDYIEELRIQSHDEFVLHPDEFALGCTLEYLRLPADLAGRLEGKSTWGRVGLQVHSTAGFVDPGFNGSLTFELQNVGKVPIPLYPGLRVAQICFYRCGETAIPYPDETYDRYAGRVGVVGSQYFRLPELQQIAKYRAQLRKTSRPSP